MDTKLNHLSKLLYLRGICRILDAKYLSDKCMTYQVLEIRIQAISDLLDVAANKYDTEFGGKCDINYKHLYNL